MKNLILLIGAALLLSACGGSDSSSGSDASEPNTAQFSGTYKGSINRNAVSENVTIVADSGEITYRIDNSGRIDDVPLALSADFTCSPAQPTFVNAQGIIDNTYSIQCDTPAGLSCAVNTDINGTIVGKQLSLNYTAQLNCNQFDLSVAYVSVAARD